MQNYVGGCYEPGRNVLTRVFEYYLQGTLLLFRELCSVRGIYVLMNNECTYLDSSRQGLQKRQVCINANHGPEAAEIYVIHLDL
jgi:hypothetical protein